MGMSRPNPATLGLFLAAVLIASSLPVWLKGGLYITNYEGDALHLADIVLRMAEGQVPHRDFATPIGVLAFWPVAIFVRAGLDLGHAFAAGQALFAIPATALVWRAAASRLPRVTAFAFGAAAVLLLSSLAHGYDTANLAVSMHYNRWAWVLAFAATLLTVLPDRGRPAPVLDGALVAVALVALGLLKVTYVVAFPPVLGLVALARGERGFLLGAVATGVGLSGLLLLMLGLAHFQGYLADLVSVRNAPLRDAPGIGIDDLLVSPGYLAGTLLMLGTAIWLRRAGRQVEGLAVLLLLPAVVFVTWQNFGNDPVWLILIAALLAAIWDSDRAGMRAAAIGAIAATVLSVPLLVVHGASGLRLMTVSPARYTVLVPDRAGLGDIRMPNLPAHLVRARTLLHVEGAPFAALGDWLEPTDPATVAGEALAECQVLTGIKGTVEAIAGDLAPEHWPVLPADILSSHWLYGGTPLPGAAPWNYGTVDGIDAARHVLVPLCPVSVRARKAVLDALAASGTTLRPVRRTETYLLFEIVR